MYLLSIYLAAQNSYLRSSLELIAIEREASLILILVLIFGKNE